MTAEQHKKEVDRLKELETELITLIANTDNMELMDKFNEWQEQRLVCNKGFRDWIEQLKDQ